MPVEYPHLHLENWPFTVVPRPDECTFLAGRPDLRDEFDRLLIGLTRRDTSSLHLLWSYFGAGKTHSLHYLRTSALARDSNLTPIRVVPVYTEFPKGARSFVALHAAVVRSLAPLALHDALLEVATSPHAGEYFDQLAISCPDFVTATRLLIMGDAPAKNVAARWLQAEQLPVGELRSHGIGRKIDSTETSTQVLSAAIDVLAKAEQLRGRRGARLLWLLDEFQRISQLSKPTITDINAGLHSLFNACPAGLTPVLTFSGPPTPKSLPDWFSKELRDRIGATRVMLLPPFQPAEAMAFVTDVLQHFRGSTQPIEPALFPFTEEACRRIIAFVQSNGELRPRTLMHAFNAVLEAADLPIEQGEMKVISPEFAQKALTGFVVVSAEDAD